MAASQFLSAEVKGISTMDANEALSSIETFEQFVGQEDLCTDIAKSRLQAIDKYIDSSKDIFNHSKKCIEDSFKNIVVVLDEWKREFIAELEKAVQDQRSILLQERDPLEENIKKFKKFMFSAKITVKACQESQREETALNFLDTLSPIVKTLLEENFYHPIPFVANKDFIKSFFKQEDKHKVGYIQYHPVDVRSLRLEPQELQPCIGSSAIFIIRASSQHEFEDLSKYLSWKVVAENKIIEANFKAADNTFILQFLVTKNVYHEVNFFLYNQHISGSPCTILPILKHEPHKFYAHEFEIKPEIVPVKMSPRAPSSSYPVKLVDRSSSSVRPPRAIDHLCKSKGNFLSTNTLKQLNEKKNMLENLELSASLALLPMSTKLVDRTSTSLRPPRALAQHNKRLSASNVDQVNDANCVKESVLNGAAKFEKLIDRSVRVNKSATIRKPFSSLKKKENKVIYDSNTIQDINAEIPIDSEFKPLLSSTSGDVAGHLKNAISKAEDNSFDDSVEPGQKTLLLDECLIKTNCALTVRNNDLAISSECNIGFKHHGLTIISDNNNNVSSHIKEEPVLMNYCLPRENDLAHLQDAKELNVAEEKSFHTFLQVKLTAKCQVFFKGNGNMQMKFPIGIAELLNGKIVVADTFNDRLLLFNNDATFILEFNGSKRLSQPSAIDVLPDGSFAVRDNHSIIIFSKECQPLKVLGNKFLSKPYGITHDNDGNIITIDVSANENFSIVKIDPISGMLISRVSANLGFHSTPDNKLSKPRFITFRDPNELLVVDLGLDFVYILKMDTGNLISKFGGHGSASGKFNDPSGIACDAEGYMFIGDSRNHRIQVFTPEGKFACILKVDRPLKRPSGIHLTAAGQLYVLNYWENSFVKYAFSVDKSKRN